VKEKAMKHKVSELEGALLDAAVAKAEGLTFDLIDEAFAEAHAIQACVTVARGLDVEAYVPSELWQDGGPIIERERISLMFIGARGWSANFDQHFDEGSQDDPHTGPTPLIAAMRAYVASKFGEEVELP
jgi:hypothetical protein